MMEFTHSKDGQLLYEIYLEIKSYNEISSKDRERINKIALLLDSLGYEEDTTEKHYRFTSEKENGELLLEVEDCSKKTKKDEKSSI